MDRRVFLSTLGGGHFASA